MQGVSATAGGAAICGFTALRLTRHVTTVCTPRADAASAKHKVLIISLKLQRGAIMPVRVQLPVALLQLPFTQVLLTVPVNPAAQLAVHTLPLTRPLQLFGQLLLATARGRP